MNMRRVHGVFRYLLATLVGIARNPQWYMELEWAEGQYQGPVTSLHRSPNDWASANFSSRHLVTVVLIDSQRELLTLYWPVDSG